MAVTIFFPEFIFAHAVTELKMALDDLFELETRAQREETKKIGQWKIDMGKCSHGVRKFLNLDFANPDSMLAPDSDAIKHKHDSEPPKWTLTHSYFANMGGIRCRLPDSGGCSSVLTAQSIGVARYPYAAINNLSLSEEEINDRAKADMFVKAITITQIAWLVLSVITRKARDLPTSQLEIVTLAFAVLAIGTYSACFYKPKDVQTTVTIDVAPGSLGDIRAQPRRQSGRRLWRPFEAMDKMTVTRRREIDEEEEEDLESLDNEREHHEREHHETEYDDPELGYESFSTVIFSANTEGMTDANRVPNDNFRDEDLIPLTLFLALVSLVFGGLHCLAWNFEFVSTPEKWIWRVASIVMGTTPMIIFSIQALTHCWARYTTSGNIKEALSGIFGLPPDWEETVKSAPTEVSEQISPPDHQSEFLKYIEDLRQLGKLSSGRDFKNLLRPLLGALTIITLDLSGRSSQDETHEFERSTSLRGIPKLEPVKVIDALKVWPPEPEFLNYLSAATSYIYYEIPSFADEYYRTFIIGIGAIYSIARLSIIVIAFTSLRAAPAGLYTNTWARFLPNLD
jgi:hypothetical protein